MRALQGLGAFLKVYGDEAVYNSDTCADLIRGTGRVEITEEIYLNSRIPLPLQLPYFNTEGGELHANNTTILAH